MSETRKRATEFDEYDLDNDDMLSFDEFKGLVASRLPPTRDARTDLQLRSWFDALDSNQDGLITKMEYFAFSSERYFCTWVRRILWSTSSASLTMAMEPSTKRTSLTWLSVLDSEGSQMSFLLLLMKMDPA